MNICKKCRKEIDPKATKCPHCQSDLRIWFVRHPILTVVLAIILVSALSSGAKKDGNQTTTPNPSDSPNVETKEVKKYKPGESFSTGKMEFTVLSIEELASVGGQYVKEKPSEGATLIAVQYKYKNVSESPLSSFTQPRVKLVDSKGTEYDPDLGKTSTYKVGVAMNEKFLSDLNPGVSVNGAQVFEIGKESYQSQTWTIKVEAEGKNYIVETK